MTKEISTDAELISRLLTTRPTPAECLVAAARIEQLANATRATPAPAAMTPEVKALVSREAATAREVFEDYGSKAKEAIDYMEQLLLAALRAGGDG